MSEGSFVEFRLMVNRVAGDPEDRFVTVVADAPVSRFNYGFGQIGGVPSWIEQIVSTDGGLRLRCDAGGHYRLEPAVPGVPIPTKQIAQIGRALFQVLFPQNSAAYDLLGRSCQAANLEGAFLRLKLDLAAELSNLPWETIKCPSTGPWAMEITRGPMSIVRYLGDIHDTAAPVRRASGKPVVIIVKADPKSCATPDVTNSLYAERDRVVNILRELSDRIDHEVIEQRDTLRALTQRVEQLEREGRPVLGLHFCGHGGIDDDGGYFLGEDDALQPMPIYEDQLRHALEPAKSIRWIILNACNTGEQPVGCPLAGLATSMALLKDVPTVIAYTRPVETADAAALAADFYDHVLRLGLPIEGVVRSVQMRYSNPGGLVILERSVAGKVQESIDLRAGARAPRPDETLLTDTRVAASAERPQSTRARPVEIDVSRMVFVHAGPFTKGLTPEQIDYLLAQFRRHDLPLDPESTRTALSGHPAEEVELPAFFVDATPVTNAEFRRFVDAGGYRTDAERAGDPRNWRVHDVADKAAHPVVYVSFYDAEAYCEWAHKRLPTADEWQKAYRGTDGRLYPWGNVYDPQKCNTAESCRGYESTPVTRFPTGASPYKCLDMVGNVEEWVTTPSGDGGKMILGGSWAMTCEVYGLPVLHRIAPPSFYSKDLGFRCARDP